MNYLIWNGNDSRDIKGLIISELPPISKPQMRVVETAIDGVDGSIIEEVGYSSYDKAIIIGLTPKADIDEISQYFNGTGEVVFSNEPDKYYNASIINQIDYARLVRFRTATVVFRVQPFKYEYLEKQAVLPSGEVAGEVIQLTDKKITKLAIDGKNIESEIPVEVEVKTINKNFLDLNKKPYKESNSELNGATVTIENGILRIDGTSATNLVTVRSLWMPHTDKSTILLHKGTYYTKLRLNLINSETLEPKQTQVGKFVLEADYYLTQWFYTVGKGAIGTCLLQIESGDEQTEYVEHKENTSVIVIDKSLAETHENFVHLELFDGINTIYNSIGANMVISYVDNKMIVNNVGNYIAKPIIEIKGSGAVQVAVNGNTLFRYTFPENEDTVIIDSKKQDAYLGAVLKNRNMMGEFPTFAIGKNTITWEGNISSIKISSKSRWL